MSQNQVSCKLECYFKNSLQFIPERWIKGDPEHEKTHPYLVLPFGHGPRACIARRLAEQNMYILLARVRKTFKQFCKVKRNYANQFNCYNQIIVSEAISYRVEWC